MYLELFLFCSCKKCLSPAKKRSLIDKIYFEKLGLAFPDVNSEHEENNEVSTVFKSRKKVYPNDLCPCGSGKKFKKCHKGKGIYD